MFNAKTDCVLSSKKKMLTDLKTETIRLSQFLMKANPQECDVVMFPREEDFQTQQEGRS